MQYIVVKPFSFAGDQYKSGDVFVPAKYPLTCDSRKLARLVSTRRLVEDFKIPSKVVEAPVKAPVKAPVEAPVEAEAKNAEVSHEDAASAPEKENVKRSKGAK